MKQISILLLMIVVPFPLPGQDPMYEDLTRPAIERPLTTYGGQLQILAGYRLVTGNKQFDDSGQKTGVKEGASTALSNDFNFQLNYGIIDFIELNANMCYCNALYSDPTVILIDYTDFSYLDRIEHARGTGDLYLGLSLRLPVRISWFDWSVIAGASLPTSAHEPGKPGHSYGILDAASGTFQVRYREYPKYGKGITVPKLGTSLRLSTEKLGLWVNYRYLPVSGELVTSQWRYRLMDESFEYTSESYRMKHPSGLYLDVSAGYQAFPWFIAYAGFFYESFSGGWTESTGQRIAFPTSHLAVVSLNYEIQVSTHLRFMQYINFPVTGKNTWSGFSFFTGISCNLVPLKNLYY